MQELTCRVQGGSCMGWHVCSSFGPLKFGAARRLGHNAQDSGPRERLRALDVPQAHERRRADHHGVRAPAFCSRATPQK